MADDKSTWDRLLDLVVYAPIGFITGSNEVVPELAAKGRAYLDPRVQVAKMVGQFAVAKGEQEAAKWVGHIRDGASSPAGSAPPDGGDEGDMEVDVTEDPLDTSAGRSDVDELAIPSYDTLAASQVISRLDGLNPVELELVRRHEIAHRGRKTILAKIAQLQAR
jgi:hypothetical protein